MGKPYVTVCPLFYVPWASRATNEALVKVLAGGLMFTRRTILSFTRLLHYHPLYSAVWS